MITLPAPTAGWDAVSPLAQMRPDAAVTLDNLIPRSRDCASRKGYVLHNGGSEGATSVGPLFSYNSDDPRLIACIDGKLLNVTNTVVTGNLNGALPDFGNDRFIANAYKDRLIFCNGEDTPVEYSGGTTVSELTITGATPGDLRGGVTYRGRVYYWEKPDGPNPQSFWYAGPGAFQGALTEFPLEEFTRGGYVVQLANWTIDGGAGLDDNLVIFMSTGEVLVYTGGDPGSATDWGLTGVYQVGEPVGELPATQVGGDLVVLTKDGYLVLSAAIREGRYSENSAFSFTINPAAQDAAEVYGSNYGWGAVLHSGDGLFIVNVPITASQSIQHVRNTATGAWCSWSGIDAVSFTTLGDQLYFIDTNGVIWVYGGTSDDGNFIQMTATQAYNYMGAPDQKKQVTTIEVQSNYALPKYLQSTFWADFNNGNLPAVVDPPEPIPGDWNVGDWDVSAWQVPEVGTKTSRKNVQGYGYALAHNLQLKSRAQRFRWYASHIYLNPMGVV